MEKKVEPKQEVGGISFIIAGIVVMLVPAIIYIVLGDMSIMLKNCALPFSTIDIGDGTIVNCTEMRFVYVLSYFCVILGAVLAVLGIAKKIMESRKKSFK